MGQVFAVRLPSPALTTVRDYELEVAADFIAEVDALLDDVLSDEQCNAQLAGHHAKDVALQVVWASNPFGSRWSRSAM
ncbi:hypothetical protein [Nocardia australiensis]|uniref:hypothetical protein n=1 Tax=Nocardia australiensis TaxID=2887191 RepID=UPI001D14BDF1|nr:hypothetical protein [Nocardia australiensis]